MTKNIKSLNLSTVFICLFLAACQTKVPPTNLWVLSETVSLPGINPIGIAAIGDQIWLSDGDHNRLVAVNSKGVRLDSITDLERPMHIAAHKGLLWIPQYGADTILSFNTNTRALLPMAVSDSLDAPAAVAFLGEEKAIADFYNHRVLFFNGDQWISIGQEGKKEGDFYYPTDVQITAQNIWVADAYNNRIQVFDKSGAFVKMIGVSEKMNAATGLFVSKDQLFVTDFENHRVLVFFQDGQLAQLLEQGLEKPIDAMVKNDTLYIVDYKKSQMNLYYFDH
jgi:DNA-binding beta-propeller fold protein YncE